MTAIKVITRFAAAFLLCSFASFGVAGGERATHFVNVKIFDGIEDTLHSQEVLVSGGMITAIGDGLVVPDDTVTIDGGGRTLMPGLLDSHTHLMINDAPHVSIYEKPWAFVGAQATAGAEAMLLRGFTTVRDIGGPVAGLKDAIDQGIVAGSRILPTGPFISQTSGHGVWTVAQGSHRNANSLR